MRMRLVEQASRRGTKHSRPGGQKHGNIAPCLYHFTAALVVVCRARTDHTRHRETLDPEENLNVRFHRDGVRHWVEQSTTP